MVRAFPNNPPLALACLALLLHGGAPIAFAGDVAVLTSADVDAYRSAVAGFKSVLVRHRVAKEYDMNGDFDRGRGQLSEIESEVQPDLILAVGAWALQVVAEKGTTIPTIYTMVLNPPAILGQQSTTITGASMNVPTERALGILVTLGPEVRRIGVVFDPSHTAYLLAEARQTALPGLEFVALEVSSPGEAVSAFKTLQDQGVDALWILPDDTVLKSPKILEEVILSSLKRGIPLLGSSPRHAEMGAPLSLYFANSEDIGRQAGELANQVFEGSPASLPFTKARKVDLVVNLRTAEKHGIRIPDEILAGASRIIR